MPLDIEDHEQLADYLHVHGHIQDDWELHCTTLAGGVSNRTVLVELPDTRGWVIKQALAKLRTKADWFSDPVRVHREALGIKWLGKLAPKGSIPGFVFEDFDEHLLAMEAVPQPHENWKTMLLEGNVRGEHVRQFGQLLGNVHRNAAESREPLKDIFADRTFFETLRVEPYYSYTSEQVPEASDFLRGLIEATRSRQLTLVHGDYSPKNVLVQNDRLVLLDHEVIHWGDPAFDLGFALTHLLSKLHHLKNAAFADAASAFYDSYDELVTYADWSRELEPFAVKHTLGCLLARVAGRSPLEYLTNEERARQRAVVTQLMAQPPDTVDDLIQQFQKEIHANG